MIGVRRSLELCASAVVAAVALATALGGLDALISWSAQPEANYVSFGAVVIAALAGVVSMLRRAVAVLVSGMAPDRSKNLELARLMTEARTDNLTGLANHRAFYDDLAAEIARRNRSGSTFSLMAIDLDGLKAINDTRGHQAGDAHIVRYAHRLRTEVGSMGTVYRTGGDEFMILLPDKRNWHAINLAHAIHGVNARGGEARALSIGVTESTQTEHRQALVRQADLALYEAKRAKLAVVPYRAALEPAGPGPSVEDVSPQQRELAAALARAVDARDHGTSNHSGLVAELAVAIAADYGLGGRRLERLRIAGLLHDVGKIAVPDVILHKPTPLATREQDMMRDHVAVGHDILVAAGFVEEAGWVMHHHEHFDGSGYPEGRTGEEIPLESRIIAVADAFEAMTGPRPYREKLSTENALAELRDRSGTQFDPSCVGALAALVGDPPVPAPRLLPVAEEPSLRLQAARRAS